MAGRNRYRQNYSQQSYNSQQNQSQSHGQPRFGGSSGGPANWGDSSKAHGARAGFVSSDTMVDEQEPVSKVTNPFAAPTAPSREEQLRAFLENHVAHNGYPLSMVSIQGSQPFGGNISPEELRWATMDSSYTSSLTQASNALASIGIQVTNYLPAAAASHVKVAHHEVAPKLPSLVPVDSIKIGPFDCAGSHKDQDTRWFKTLLESEALWETLGVAPHVPPPLDMR